VLRRKTLDRNVPPRQTTIQFLVGHFHMKMKRNILSSMNLMSLLRNKCVNQRITMSRNKKNTIEKILLFITSLHLGLLQLQYMAISTGVKPVRIRNISYTIKKSNDQILIGIKYYPLTRIKIFKIVSKDIIYRLACTKQCLNFIHAKFQHSN
jgi:hypothetical protein